VAGLAGFGGSADGLGDDARFLNPLALTMDGSGFLCVADAGNSAVRTTRILPPTLRFLFAANQIILTWPNWPNDFVLETSGSVGPGALWAPLTNGVVQSGDSFFLTNNPTGAASFYRLHRP
jgi:hypothetical protein